MSLGKWQHEVEMINGIPVYQAVKCDSNEWHEDRKISVLFFLLLKKKLLHPAENV